MLLDAHYLVGVYCNQWLVTRLRIDHNDVGVYTLCFKIRIFKCHFVRGRIFTFRYNDFMNDPLSACPCKPPYTSNKAISARDELNDPKGQYPIRSWSYRLHGGTDAKRINNQIKINPSLNSATEQHEYYVINRKTGLNKSMSCHYGQCDS
ncbi:unnamed protein product [Schistosoma curassoni]|uniref:Phospholipase B-like n=1 Tax=Schistosoma curassoni TaxID=6186 RepID=A0A183JHI2_9TREM|nr:unnamed protein product [Schistosoma curassoni]